MNSLTEAMSVMPKLEVEANKQYCYKIVQYGRVLAEFVFHITALSYSQKGLEDVEICLTDARNLGSVTHEITFR